MGFIHRNRTKPRKKLDLRVEILQAKDLVLSDARSTLMVAAVALNCRSKRTKKVKRTANPTWNDSFRFPLTSYDSSDILHLVVYDKHRRYANYLGELRLSLTEIIDESSAQPSFKVAPTWFKLRSSSEENKFVTGSIQISIEVMCKSNLAERYASWKHSLVKPKAIVVNEQDFYSDAESETDVESLLAEQENDNSNTRLISHSISGLDLTSASQGSLLEPPHLLHYDSTSDVSVSDSQLDAPQSLSYQGSTPASSSKSTSSSSNNMLRSPHRTPSSHGSQLTGVVFLEIISASDLPPYKSRIKQNGFDMDPFVVISFGKKTYRTSWRKHTLCPVFNQKLAFEVVSNELNFDVLFTILDKDRISFHDKVSEGYIPLRDVIANGGEEEYNLKMKLHKSKLEGSYDPHLKLKVQYKSYSQLQNELWDIILSKYGPTYDLMQIEQLLEDTQIEEDFGTFFQANGKTIEDTLSAQEVLKVISNKNVHLTRCPICSKKRYNELVTHVAICSSKVNKLKSFASTQAASKRWYSKVLIKVVYGKYALGKNNANILVQDRETGFIMEEKMALYIRLGIRMLYKGKGADSKKIKNVLKNMSVKQGIKFDNTSSVKDVDGFIKFYKLDLSECEDPKNWTTFNEFFYRKLKPGMRLPETPDSKIITSPADCRCTAFNTTESAQQVWIKGRSFTISKLLGDAYQPEFENCSVGIFRLAPQDYHRFHCPVDGVVQKSTEISGEYYTVNPMAIRSHLDVYGENVRVVTPIDTKEFGRIMFVAVGAMMVGSTVMTVKEGEEVKRSDELGYFKFGGSTVLVLFQKGTMQFDSDLVQNSQDCIETLVRVGMSVGHHVDAEEHKREKVSFKDEPEETRLRIIRTITGGDADTRPWEYYNLEVNSDDELDDEEEDEDYDEYDED